MEKIGEKTISSEEYLRSPATASSLPFWKAEHIVVPDSMRILRNDEFEREAFNDCEDEPYFKLVHRLKCPKRPALPAGYRLSSASYEEFSEHITACYGGGPSADELRDYEKHSAFDPDLWLAVRDEEGRVAASGIAEIDSRIGEGVLEWIQVSKAHRRRGLGEFLVRELLWRMREKASFVTVSGEIGNPSDPLALYLRCGFSEKTVWHVLKKSRANDPIPMRRDQL